MRRLLAIFSADVKSYLRTNALRAAVWATVVVVTVIPPFGRQLYNFEADRWTMLD